MEAKRWPCFYFCMLSQDKSLTINLWLAKMVIKMKSIIIIFDQILYIFGIWFF